MCEINIETLIEYKQTFTDLPPQSHEFAQQVENKRKINMEKIIKTNWRAIRTRPEWLVKRDKGDNGDDKIIGEMRCIFNKINAANYKNMIDSLFEIKITNHKQLSQLVIILLHKILFEEYNHDIYIYVYQRLMQMYIVDDNKQIYFRGMFLEKSQKLFRESIAFTQPNNSMIKDKKASINFICFLGLLYKNKLFTDQIANRCLMDLFFAIEKGDHELIDAISAFLDIIESELEDQAKKNLMAQLKKVQNKKGLEKRFQFKLGDTIDLLEGN